MVQIKAFLANRKHQYHVSQCREHDCCGHYKKNEDYYEYPNLSYFTDELRLRGKWWKEKLFFQIESISIVYPNVESMIVVTIRKRIEIIMSTQVCHIFWMNFDYNKNGGKKSFSCKTKASISGILFIRMSFCSSIMRRLKIIMKIHVCHIFRTDDSMENGGK